MKVELEKVLWDSIKVRGERLDERRTARAAITAMLHAGIIRSPKPAWATLDKWSGRGIYDYGVTLDLGWREPDASFPRQAELDRDANAASGVEALDALPLNRIRAIGSGHARARACPLPPWLLSPAR